MNFNGVSFVKPLAWSHLNNPYFIRNFGDIKNHIGIRNFVEAKSMLAKCGEWLIAFNNEIGESKISWV
jgi:hypothetical protein